MTTTIVTKIFQGNITVADCVLPNDAQPLEQLLEQTDIINRSLRSIFGIESVYSGNIVVSKLSDYGRNRVVYRIDAADNEFSFALKIARNTSSDNQDHFIFSKVANDLLGLPEVIGFYLPDERIVVTGRICSGISGERSLQALTEETVFLITKQAVEDWQKLGGFYIHEPHAGQYIVDAENHTASLIDKGHFKFQSGKRDQIKISHSRNGSLGIETELDLTDLASWIQPVTLGELLSSLYSYLNEDLKPSEVQSEIPGYDVDYEGSGFASSKKYHKPFPVTKMIEGLKSSLGCEHPDNIKVINDAIQYFKENPYASTGSFYTEQEWGMIHLGLKSLLITSS